MEHADIRDRLQSSGLKPTHQRIVIFESVHRTKTHPTADKIFDALRDQHPSLSLGTVYRTLDKFVEAGLVKRVSSPDGVMLFDANEDTHHHLVCHRSNHIHDFVDDELTQMIRDYLAKRPIQGFEIDEFQLQIFGKCSDEAPDTRTGSHSHAH